MPKLTDTAVRAAREPGRYGDGDGLFLHVRAGGSRNWVVRVQKDGRRRDIGLGGYPKLALAEARKRAAVVRSQVELRLDPVLERRKAAGVPTFAVAAKARHSEIAKGFRNPKHRAQWLASLNAYVFPLIGAMGVDTVMAANVRDALLPIWLEKPETARRVLQRVADVLTWAVAKQYRADVPMLSPKALRLPKQRREQAHHAALPFDDMPAFFLTLREREGISRLALEALILTAARPSEIRGATWDEVDLEAGLWTVPAERMKAGKLHVAPLSPEAADAFRRALLFRRPAGAHGDLVFPGMVEGRPLSDMALIKLLRDMGEGVTAHGFRSSFRDWAAERTDFTNEVAEKALAHALRNKTEAAYRRGNLLDKRRELLNAWGRFVTGGNAAAERPAAATIA